MNFFAFIFLLTTTFLNSASFQNIKLIGGSIIPSQREALGGINIFFSGYRTTTDSSGSFILKTNRSTLKDKVYLLFSKGLTWQKSFVKKNGIKRLKINVTQNKNKEYLFYSVNLSQKNPSIVKESLESFDFKVPLKNSIIFNINPNYVESSFKKKAIPVVSNFLSLPTIKLKSAETIKKEPSECKAAFSNKAFIERLKAKTFLNPVKEFKFHEELRKNSALKKRDKMKNVQVDILL